MRLILWTDAAAPRVDEAIRRALSAAELRDASWRVEDPSEQKAKRRLASLAIDHGARFRVCDDQITTTQPGRWMLASEDGSIASAFPFVAAQSLADPFPETDVSSVGRAADLAIADAVVRLRNAAGGMACVLADLAEVLRRFLGDPGASRTRAIVWLDEPRPDAERRVREMTSAGRLGEASWFLEEDAARVAQRRLAMLATDQGAKLRALSDQAARAAPGTWMLAGEDGTIASESADGDVCPVGRLADRALADAVVRLREAAEGTASLLVRLGAALRGDLGEPPISVAIGNGR